MAPSDVKSVTYLDTPTSATGDYSNARAIAHTCAECVRGGAKNVRVFRSQDGMNTHLKIHHGQ